MIDAAINAAVTNVNVHLYLSHQIDGHAAEMGPELDEEMEKVFAMDAGEKFELARLGSPSESAGSDRDRDRDRGPPPRYGGDRDFNRKSYCRFSMFFIFTIVSSRIKNNKNDTLYQNTVKEAIHIRTCPSRACIPDLCEDIFHRK